jgi:hypothetical protein
VPEELSEFHVFSLFTGFLFGSEWINRVGVARIDDHDSVYPFVWPKEPASVKRQLLGEFFYVVILVLISGHVLLLRVASRHLYMVTG